MESTPSTSASRQGAARKVMSLHPPLRPVPRSADAPMAVKPRYRATVGVKAPPLAPHLFQPGRSGNGLPKGRKKTLMGRVREILRQKSKFKDGNTQLDDVAEAFVMAMMSGSFVHLKEYIDREEGKIPTRLADAEGGNLKLYVGMPTDGDPNAP